MGHGAGDGEWGTETFIIVLFLFNKKISPFVVNKYFLTLIESDWLTVCNYICTYCTVAGSPILRQYASFIRQLKSLN